MLSRRLLTVAARLSARRSAPVAVRFSSTEAQIAEVKKQSNLKEGEPQIEGHVASESKYEQVSVWQEPNRATTWSRSQKPRGQALTGPRFEQTEIDAQPAPEAAIELIHKQPVRFIDSRHVSCDGGGGPHGHPRIFINLDKPQICACTYCGLPYAYKGHKTFLESLEHTPYPLESTGDAAEVEITQRVAGDKNTQR